MKSGFGSLLLLAGALACGHRGSGGGSAATTTASGTVSDNAPDVEGSFALGSQTTPAAGYELWLFDQTLPSLRQNRLDKDGAFVVPIANFIEGHTYSWHLVSNFNLIADLNVSGSSPSTMAFRYDGGFGFSLGQVVIPLGPLGQAKGSGLGAPIGGGFSALHGTDGSFAAYPLPSSTSEVMLGSQLYVFDPETLLYSFYNRASNPDAYARDLKRLARVGGVVTATSDAEVTGVTLAAAGSWVAAARLPVTVDAEPEQSPFWSPSAGIPKVSTGRYEFSVYSAGVIPANAIGIFRITPEAGREPTVPRLVPRSVSYPPTVAAVSGSGGSTAAVDYTPASTANGLTLPFCVAGDAVLDLTPPQDGTGTVIPASLFNRIEAYVDYYATTNGVTSPVAVNGTQLPSPYNAIYNDTSITDLGRSWDPAKQLLTFTLGPSVVAAQTQEVRLWSGLFSSTVGSQTINLVRLRLYYKSATEATAGASAVWFKLGC